MTTNHDEEGMPMRSAHEHQAWQRPLFAPHTGLIGSADDDTGFRQVLRRHLDLGGHAGVRLAATWHFYSDRAYHII